MLEIQMDAVCHANHLTTWTYKQVGTPKMDRVVPFKKFGSKIPRVITYWQNDGKFYFFKWHT